MRFCIQGIPRPSLQSLIRKQTLPVPSEPVALAELAQSGGS